MKLSMTWGIHNEPAPKRPYKGKSIIKTLLDYVVVDLETTGLDPNYEEIIEVAAIRVNNGDISNCFHTLVKPFNEIDGFITELTGITNEMLSTAPPIKSVIQNFIDFIGDSILVAHNAHFDINFIYDNYDNHFCNDFIDTMRISRRLFGVSAGHRLSDLVERFGIDGVVEHRAMSDAIKTYHCYEYMKRYASDNGIDFTVLPPTLRAKDITLKADSFKEDTDIFGRSFVFTGKLEKMPRRDAMQIVVDMGGLCLDGVNVKTNYLVLGNLDYSKNIKDGKSSKLKKAETLKLSGVDIEVISENIFYDMIAHSID